ncbi:MAG: DNA gyrase modulator [Nitrospinota bacterium]
MTLMSIAEGFRKIAPEADFWSVRIVRQRGENLTVRNGILQPAAVSMDIGAMVTVCDWGGMGYAASSDLSERGLRRSADEALAGARKNSGRMVPRVAALISLAIRESMSAPAILHGTAFL